MDNFYRGYRNFKLTDDELAQFYKGEYEVAPGLENEYLIIYNEDEEPIDYFCWKNNSLEKVKFPVLGNEFTGKMKPRNPQQYCAMDLLKDDRIPLKLITGNFGSGKSMMCVVAALEALQKGKLPEVRQVCCYFLCIYGDICNQNHNCPMRVPYPLFLYHS